MNNTNTIEQFNANITVTVERIGFSVSNNEYVKCVKKAEEVYAIVGTQVFTLLCDNRIENSILNRRIKKLATITGLVANEVKSVVNGGFETQYRGVEFSAPQSRFDMLNSFFA